MTQPKMDPADIVRLSCTWEALGVPKEELVEEESQFFELLSVMWRTDPEMALLVASSRWRKTFVFETVSKLCSAPPQCVKASAASRQPDPPVSCSACAASPQPVPCAASSRLSVPQPVKPLRTCSRPASCRVGGFFLSRPSSTQPASRPPDSLPASAASRPPGHLPPVLAPSSGLVGDSWTSSSLVSFLMDLPLEPDSPRTASSQPALSRPDSLWPDSLEARLPPEFSFEGSRLAIFSGSRGGHRRRPGHQQRPVCNQLDPRPASAASRLPDPRPVSAASSLPDLEQTPVPSSVPHTPASGEISPSSVTCLASGRPPELCCSPDLPGLLGRPPGRPPELFGPCSPPALPLGRPPEAFWFPFALPSGRPPEDSLSGAPAKFSGHPPEVPPTGPLDLPGLLGRPPGRPPELCFPPGLPGLMGGPAGRLPDLFCPPGLLGRQGPSF
ncbi:proline-rich protein 36-like [Micropterus dolomieu]|uniref:proline-rich protein 36-like n=1 Tax=Micropterus dolomieu TaxID=147949 RepID=UPI001E8CC066|nr:proline-rich protein 36-like [Micropterus dolomieu]